MAFFTNVNMISVPVIPDEKKLPPKKKTSPPVVIPAPPAPQAQGEDSPQLPRSPCVDAPPGETLIVPPAEALIASLPVETIAAPPTQTISAPRTAESQTLIKAPISNQIMVDPLTSAAIGYSSSAETKIGSVVPQVPPVVCTNQLPGGLAKDDTVQREQKELIPAAEIVQESLLEKNSVSTDSHVFGDEDINKVGSTPILPLPPSATNYPAGPGEKESESKDEILSTNFSQPKVDVEKTYVPEVTSSTRC